MQNDKIHWL